MFEYTVIHTREMYCKILL